MDPTRQHPHRPESAGTPAWRYCRLRWINDCYFRSTQALTLAYAQPRQACSDERRLTLATFTVLGFRRFGVEGSTLLGRSVPGVFVSVKADRTPRYRPPAIARNNPAATLGNTRRTHTYRGVQRLSSSDSIKYRVKKHEPPYKNSPRFSRACCDGCGGDPRHTIAATEPVQRDGVASVAISW